MKSSLLKIIFLASSLTIATCALVAEETYTIASTENYPPFSFLNSDGEATGIDIDIIMEAARRANINVEIKLYPWARALQMAESGAVDGIAGCFHRPEREEFLYYTKPPLRDIEIVFFSKKNHPSPKKLSDITGKRVGTVLKYFISNEFNEAIHFSKKELSSPRLLFNILIGNGIDVAVYSKDAGLYELQKFPQKKRNEITFSRYEDKPVTSSHLVFSKKSKLGRRGKQIFNLNLGEMKIDGAMDAIYKKYR